LISANIGKAAIAATSMMYVFFIVVLLRMR